MVLRNGVAGSTKNSEWFNTWHYQGVILSWFGLVKVNASNIEWTDDFEYQLHIWFKLYTVFIYNLTFYNKSI